MELHLVYFLQFLVSETCLLSCAVLILAVKVTKCVLFCSLACSRPTLFLGIGRAFNKHCHVKLFAMKVTVFMCHIPSRTEEVLPWIR